MMAVMRRLSRRTRFSVTPISLAVSWTVGNGVVIITLVGMVSTYKVARTQTMSKERDTEDGYPVSIGSDGSTAHSESEASYTATRSWPSSVSTNASLLAAMPPPQ